MITEKDISLYRSFQKSPLTFIQAVWGLLPERDNTKFIKGKHITWQQEKILLAIENSLKGEGSKRITIAAGRGIGKTTCLSWIILWYLFCFKDAQIACTAPTAEQMNDALWKELNLWLGRMPKWMSDLYEWGTTHLRIKERSATWFARARTARKENPEALAGIHGEYVMLIADEASGIDDNIFKIAEGALTGTNYFFITISNPRRLIGYFRESHKPNSGWEQLSFSSIESPVVEKDFVEEISKKYGTDSDEYRIEVLGQFPKADAVDEGGYVPLFLEGDLRISPEIDFVGIPEIGLDPSGEGDDDTVWAGRDRFRMKVLDVERVSNDKSMARKSIDLLHRFGARARNLNIDNFGVGANVSREIAMSNDPDIGDREANSFNVGEPAEDNERFLNKRAELYFRMKEWFSRGGEICQSRWSLQLVKELLTIRYRRERNGKLKIKSKDEMRKDSIASPNMADAASLTFSKNPVVEERGSDFVQYRPKQPRSSRFG